MLDQLKKIVGNVAPVLGNMIGGPLGGAAISALSQALLGKPSSTEEELVKAVQNATPDQRVEMMRIDNAFKIEMRNADIKEQKIYLDDKDSARRRQVKANDKTPAILAYCLAGGFFGILFYMMMFGVQESAVSIINIMVGALGASFVSVINFFFGSSQGSKDKTFMLGK